MVERIRTLLTRFPEDEEAVRQLVAQDVSFDALCNEYGKVITLLAFVSSSQRRRSCARVGGTCMSASAIRMSTSASIRSGQSIIAACIPRSARSIPMTSIACGKRFGDSINDVPPLGAGVAANAECKASLHLTIRSAK